MIKILFPPGCYGTYLTRCIYNYSNLREEEFTEFEFDEFGSSHDFRNNRVSRFKLQSGHLTTLKIDSSDTVISLLPDQNESLEYYNNQFFKQQQGQIIQYINASFSENEIAEKLKNNWGHTKIVDSDIPRWILREWCSFWITDSWTDGYNRQKYQQVGNISVEVSDLLTDISTVLDFIFAHLGLEFSVHKDLIKKTHQKFLQSQRFLRSQKTCNETVACMLNNTFDIDIKVQTIFDEAYIQHLLRTNGYEMRCDGVDFFPKTGNEMKELIYKI